MAEDALGVAPVAVTASPSEGGGPVLVLPVRELGRYAAAWDELALLAPLPSPFLRSWWLTATAPTSARFLLVLAGPPATAQLIGGLAVEAGRRAGLPVVRPLGIDGLAPDHLDLLARPGWEAEVGAALRRWLFRPGSRLLDLSGLAPTHRLAPVLGPRAVSSVIEEAPWVPLVGDFAAFSKATLPGIMRNSIRRSAQKLDRQGGLEFRVVPPADVERCLDRLRELHFAQFGADSGLILAFDRFADAARTGAACGELQLFELVVGGTVAAVDVAFSVADRFSYYQGGRDTSEAYSGAGTVLMARGIEWACEAGCTEVDFLRGTEPYKEQWAQHRRPVLRLVAGVGPGGVAAVRLMQLRHWETTRWLARPVRGLLSLPGWLRNALQRSPEDA